MAETTDLGRAFAHAIALDPNAPRLHTAVTDELDPPFRRSRSLVLRLWKSRGLVLGWWRKTGRDEDEALMAALQGVETSLLDEDGYLLPNFEVEDV